MVAAACPFQMRRAVPAVYDWWMEAANEDLWVIEQGDRVIGCHAAAWTARDEVFPRTPSSFGAWKGRPKRQPTCWLTLHGKA